MVRNKPKKYRVKLNLDYVVSVARENSQIETPELFVANLLQFFNIVRDDDGTYIVPERSLNAFYDDEYEIIEEVS